MTSVPASPKRLSEVRSLTEALVDQVLEAQIVGRQVPHEQSEALIKAAFDAFDHKDPAALTYGPVVVIAVTALRGFALLGQTVLTNRVVTRVEADMQAALYGHLIEADLAQLGRESPAAFTQRFTTDFAFIKEALTRLFTVPSGVSVRAAISLCE